MKKTNKFNLIQKYFPPSLRKSFDCPFEIISKLKAFTISTFKWSEISSYKYKFKQILKKIGQPKTVDPSFVFR